MNLSRTAFDGPQVEQPARTGPRPLLLCHARLADGPCFEVAIVVDADSGLPLCMAHALGGAYAEWSAYRVARLTAWACEDFKLCQV